MKNNELSAIAEKVTTEMKKAGVIVHRYDAFTTSSIYLKFDYGVANSLRISNHPGKKYLRYRYNILTDQKAKAEKMDNGFKRIFYSPAMINAVCRDILQSREEKKARYKDYEKCVKDRAASIAHEKGFWQQAKRV